MAKRSSTVYLEDMFWDMISQYQEKNNLSSRNDALAFMLKEWEMFNQGKVTNIVEVSPKVINEVTDNIVVNNKETSEDNVVVEDKIEVNPLIKGGLNQILGSLNNEE